MCGSLCMWPLRTATSVSGRPLCAASVCGGLCVCQALYAQASVYSLCVRPLCAVASVCIGICVQLKQAGSEACAGPGIQRLMCQQATGHCCEAWLLLALCCRALLVQMSRPGASAILHLACAGGRGWRRNSCRSWRTPPPRCTMATLWTSLYERRMPMPSTCTKT